MTSDEFNPVAGQPLQLAQGLRLLLAPNPSPMTYLGTNTYLLGETEIGVIDPGPDDDAHLDAIMDATGIGTITHIIITHAHLDHSPLARRLSARTGAPVYGFGPADAGRSPVMERLARQGLAGGSEGIDTQFDPDICIGTGDVINTKEWALEALHTPGHIGNHLSFLWNKAVFTGDHVMGWASSLVSPPDGDLTDFMTSCAALRDIPSKTYYPGHGAPITNPTARLDWLIKHRLTREAQIRSAITPNGSTIDEITQVVYADIAPALLPAARRNVFAHLIDLTQRGILDAAPSLKINAVFSAKSPDQN